MFYKVPMGDLPALNEQLPRQAGIEGVDRQDHGRIAFDAAPLYPVTRIGQSVIGIHRTRSTTSDQS